VLDGVGHGAELVDSGGGVKGSLVRKSVLTTEFELNGGTSDTFEAFAPTVGELIDVANIGVVGVSATNGGVVLLEVGTGVDIGVGGVPDELGKDLLEVVGVVLNGGTDVVFVLDAHVDLGLDGLLLLFVNLNGEVLEEASTTEIGGSGIESNGNLSVTLGRLVLDGDVTSDSEVVIVEELRVGTPGELVVGKTESKFDTIMSVNELGGSLVRPLLGTLISDFLLLGEGVGHSATLLGGSLDDKVEPLEGINSGGVGVDISTNSS